MLFFVHAARLAMVAFDPYLSSRPLADAFHDSPPGNLIIDHEYYAFSSVLFYTNREALLLNGEYTNAEARLRDHLSDEEIASVNASLARSLAQLHVKRRRRRP